MPVSVINRDYNNRFKPQVVDWLIGNTGDWQTIDIEAIISVSYEASQSEQIILEQNKLVLTNGKFWNEYGFDIGDSFSLDYRFTSLNSDGTTNQVFNQTVSRNIVSLNSDTLVYDGLDLNDGGSTLITNMPSKSGNYILDNIRVYVDKRPEGIEVRYNHMKNSESENDNLNSFIDGNQTILTAINTHLLNLNQVGPVEKLGIQSGMAINASSCTYLGKIGTNEYRYRIQIEFMIASFYNDKENLELNIAPEETLGVESLTDNFSFIAYPEWNNPNTQIKNELKDTRRLGNTGWLGENFNGLKDNFTVESIQFNDIETGQLTTSLSHTAETKVTAVISGIENLALGISTCGFGFIWVTEDENAIKNKETSFHQNSLMNTGGGIGTGIFTPSFGFSNTLYQGFSFDGNTRMDIKDIRFSVDNGNLVYEATFAPTAQFTEFMESKDSDDRNFAIWVSVADHTLVTNFSDRVNKLLYYGELTRYIPEVGEWSPMIIQMFEHPEDGLTEVDQSRLIFIEEDDIQVINDFKINLEEEIPSSIIIAIEAVKTDGTVFNLSEYTFALSSFITTNDGIPQWDLEQNAGFRFKNQSPKNVISIKRNPAEDSGNFVAYQIIYNLKARWEDWIIKSGVNVDFYDLQEQNNGFNENWARFSSDNDWTTRLAFYTLSQIEGSVVIYSNYREFEILEYLSNDIVDENWSFNRESDSFPVNTGTTPQGVQQGILIENERIKISCTFTRTEGTWQTLDDVYSIIRLEIFEGPGQSSIWQMSSEYKAEGNNPLENDNDLLSVTLVSPTEIIVECFLNSSKLEQADVYKVSSRIGCKQITA